MLYIYNNNNNSEYVQNIYMCQHFRANILIYIHSNPMGYVLPSFYRQGNEDTERLSNLPIQLVSLGFQLLLCDLRVHALTVLLKKIL